MRRVRKFFLLAIWSVALSTVITTPESAQADVRHTQHQLRESAEQSPQCQSYATHFCAWKECQLTGLGELCWRHYYVSLCTETHYKLDMCVEAAQSICEGDCPEEVFAEAACYAQYEDSVNDNLQWLAQCLDITCGQKPQPPYPACPTPNSCE